VTDIHKTKRVKMMLRIILVLLAAYAALVILAYFAQKKLLYFPDRPSLQILIASSSHFGLELWPSQDANYRGLINTIPRADYTGTVIVFHGNGGSARDRLYYIQPLERLGYRVILAEYPDYGARPGRHGERTFAADAIETVNIARKTFAGPLILWGESLGCGVAANVVKHLVKKPDGVVLLTPFDSLPNLAQKLYRFLPARLLVKDKYDNIGNLRDYAGPIAVLMAGQDEIIPGILTKHLYESLTTSKKLWVFPNAGHNSWPADPDEPWWAEVMTFLENS
jgi:pimeloyl-ACP methyl ester carboxylesterase